MKFKTAITKIDGDKEYIRGYALEDLVQKKSFVETIFLLLKGELPNKNEARMLDAMLTAAIDHGPGTASALTARVVASSKNSMHTALAAGILAMGERHGSAIEWAGKFFQENADAHDVPGLAKKLKEEKVRVAGYGHAVLKHDHRSDLLFSLAKETKIYGKHCAFAEQFGKELNALSSKPLPLNIDGAMAAVASDMGFDWQIMKGLFIIARMPGLVAQVYEESTDDPGLRRLDEEGIEYVGEKKRKL